MSRIESDCKGRKNKVVLGERRQCILINRNTIELDKRVCVTVEISCSNGIFLLGIKIYLVEKFVPEWIFFWREGRGRGGGA